MSFRECSKNPNDAELRNNLCVVPFEEIKTHGPVSIPLAMAFFWSSVPSGLRCVGPRKPAAL